MTAKRGSRKPAGQKQRRQVVVEHPGVLAAHDGPVTPAECAHLRRDAKNPSRCCACGAVGLPEPAKAKRAR